MHVFVCDATLTQLACEIFRRTLWLLSSFTEHPGRAVATSVLQRLTATQKVQVVKRLKKKNHCRLVIFTFLYTEAIPGACSPGHYNLNALLGAQIVQFTLTQFYHRLFLLMLNRCDGYSSHHCRCLFKELISHSHFSILQLYPKHSHVNQAPWAFRSDESLKRCFPHRNHKVNVTSNQSSRQQSGNHLTNIPHKQNN